MRIRASAQKIAIRRSIDLFFHAKRENGTVCVAEPVRFSDMDDEFRLPDPTVSLRLDEAQELMDELWSCGLRPSEGTGSAGSLRATERHLEDMRRIVSGLLSDDGVKL